MQWDFQESLVFYPGAQLYYPNTYNSSAGTRFDFWNYDPDQKGWYVYGHGTVSFDRSQIIPDTGVEVYEFTGAMVASAIFADATAGRCQDNNKPKVKENDFTPGCEVGEPVDLSPRPHACRCQSDRAHTNYRPVGLPRCVPSAWEQ